jgi:hypothetical protein
MKSLRLAAGILTLSVAACGSSPPPDSAAPAAPTGAVVAKPSLDLSPVPAPAGHFATVRVKNVEPLLRFAASKATPGDPQAGVRMGVAELASKVLGDAASSTALADAVAVDAPIHVVAAIAGDASAPDAHVAVSVGLKSLEGARAAIRDAREIAPGQWAVRDGDVPCLVAAAPGAVPARLVCGKDEASVVALAPYLVRTLGSEPAPAQDVTAEIRFAPIDERFGRDVRRLLPQATLLARSELAIGEPKFDRAIERAAGGLANELGAWLADFDTLTARGSMAPDGGAEGSVGLTFRGNTSWLAATTADAVARQTQTPAMFWQLPKDAHGASWSSGWDGARWNDILAVVRDLVEGGLTKYSIGTPDDRKAIAALVAVQPGVRPATVSANGTSPAAPGDARTPQAEIERALRSAVGWHLIGFAEPADSTVKWLKDLSAAYGKPSVQNAIKKHVSSKEAAMIPTIKPAAAPAALGKGAYAVEITVPNIERGAAKVKATLHVLVMPDGNQHFVGLGADRDDLVKHLLATKSGAAKDGTLAARPGLDGLRGVTGSSGGFLTLRDFASGSATDLEDLGGDRPDRDMQRLRQALEKLPNKGETPVLFTAKAAAQPLSITTEVDAPKGVVDDVVALIDELARGGAVMAAPRP